MAKIDTQSMTKMTEKPDPLGHTYLYSPYKGVPPPLPGDVDMAWLHLKITTDKSTTLVSIPLHGHVQAHLHLGTGKYMYIIAVAEQIQ